jgi:hypothetical protein
MEERDHARSLRLEEYNNELERRIEALDRGKSVSSRDAQAKPKQKSAQRRKARA